ncbi:MmgE/PrpD family protein [Pigmentiphaga litoralis]|uniref:2-methylcitrate dehydratase PrpD n=1 Tax=Pigmentiphaga litoralis TaxID=516702 RepID=A0A7Y9IUC2_9BURK|nr:MmgE/PrpD family protein [Pigmentiphaga litoralis]NYE23160.1 2-methylcitrate dehydratase PrpD [Pigmentiphaga litoralis]NYE83225.1 2-methylcitrate dehydratase PrpD [Pigmentiphaga litoralis]
MQKTMTQGPTLAQSMGAFLNEARIGDMPPQAVEYGQMLVASTLASAALGSTLTSSQIVRQLEVDRGGHAQAAAWFGNWDRLPAVAAARINALMSDAAASDDSDLRNIVHSGTPACAAALAVGQHQRATGSEIVEAIVFGYEVAGTINTAMLGGLQRKGFHGCVVATFAAAAAAACLLKLDRDAAAHALALAATSMGGLHAAAATSLAREYHAGNAAMMGVHAAQAAARGYQAELATFEMKRGFFETLGGGADASGLAGQLGSKWNILTELGIKLVPGGSPFHAVAEAAASAAREGRLTVDDIRHITFTLPDYPFPGPKHPADLIGIEHSPFYFAAAGAADHDYGWTHAFPEKINDPRIRSLFDRITRSDDDVVDKHRYKSGAIVTIETTDGRLLEHTVLAPKGAAVRGISWPDIRTKYDALMPHGGVLPQAIDRSFDQIRRLTTLPSIDGLIGMLSGKA